MAMTAAFILLSRIIDDLFERHMLRAAGRISARQRLFSPRA